MTDETGRIIAFAIHIQTTLQYVNSMYEKGVISHDDYKKRMEGVENALLEQTKLFRKFIASYNETKM